MYVFFFKKKKNIQKKPTKLNKIREKMEKNEYKFVYVYMHVYVLCLHFTSNLKFVQKKSNSNWLKDYEIGVKYKYPEKSNKIKHLYSSHKYS